MHWRQPLTSPSLFPGWSSGRMLLWVCLAVVVATTACAFQLTASSMVSARATYPSTRTAVIGQDATTGDRIQLECVVTGDSGANNTLLVEVDELSDVAARVCTDYRPPAITHDSPYRVVR